MTKAASYYRFSPRRDASTSTSIDAQRTICRDYCRRMGYDLSAEFEDRNLSGDDETRPGLWAAVESLRRGWVLVVSDPERLARSVFLEESIYREVEAKRARIEAVEGGTSGTTPEDQMIRQIFAVFRQYYKRVAAAKTKSRMLAYQSVGRAMSHHAPYGFREAPESNGKRRWEPDDAEQAIIARIATWAAEGRSTGWIAKRLNSIGEPCRGKAWHRETVRRILARTS